MTGGDARAERTRESHWKNSLYGLRLDRRISSMPTDCQRVGVGVVLSAALFRSLITSHPYFSTKSADEEEESLF